MFHLKHYSRHLVLAKCWTIYDLSGHQIGAVGQNGAYSFVSFRGEYVARINERGDILSLEGSEVDGRVSNQSVVLNGQTYNTTVSVAPRELAAAAVCAYLLDIEEIVRMIDAEVEAPDGASFTLSWLIKLTEYTTLYLAWLKLQPTTIQFKEKKNLRIFSE